TARRTKRERKHQKQGAANAAFFYLVHSSEHSRFVLRIFDCSRRLSTFASAAFRLSPRKSREAAPGWHRVAHTSRFLRCVRAHDDGRWTSYMANTATCAPFSSSIRDGSRSEERRVGKECRARSGAEQKRKITRS